MKCESKPVWFVYIALLITPLFSMANDTDTLFNDKFIDGIKLTSSIAKIIVDQTSLLTLNVVIDVLNNEVDLHFQLKNSVI